jgi:hypothetical protein
MIKVNKLHNNPMRGHVMKSKLKNIILKIFRLSQFLRRRFSYISMFTILQKLESLPDFPNSQCSDSQFLNMTLDGARSTYIDLSQLLTIPTVNLTKISEFLDCKGFDFTESDSIFGDAFSRHGSDKGSVHNYHKVYSRIFQELNLTIPNILEIGLGTNNTSVASNMGRRGRPGASLRAWKDLFPESPIVGADIDSSVLFQEKNIMTYQLDQTSPDSWKSFTQILGKRKFHLVIDDGLHSPSANLKSLLFGLDLLEESGFLVVEDIHPRALPVWSIALSGLKQDEKYWFLETASSLCLVIQSGVSRSLEQR